MSNQTGKQAESNQQTNAQNGHGQSGAPRLVFDHPTPEGAAKTVSQVLGEIVWLMSQSPLHKQMFISDLEWLVMTPILLQQFRLFYDSGDEKSAPKPIGCILWAHASEEVGGRLAQGVGKMRPQDWRSGEEIWIVEVLAPFGGVEDMVRDFKTRVFPEKPVHFLALVGGKKDVRVV